MRTLSAPSSGVAARPRSYAPPWRFSSSPCTCGLPRVPWHRDPSSILPAWAAPNMPTVQITGAAVGENLTEANVNVTRTVGDPDGDPLPYVVLCSLHAAATWQTPVTGPAQMNFTTFPRLWRRSKDGE